MAVKMKSIIGLIFCLLFFCGEISLSQPSVNNNQNGNEPVNAILPSDISEIKAGNELLINRNFEDAIDYYKKAISKNKAISYYNLGVSYFILGDYKHSEEYFKLSLAVKPDFHEALMNLALTFNLPQPTSFPWSICISEHGPHGPVSPIDQKLSLSPFLKILFS